MSLKCVFICLDMDQSTANNKVNSSDSRSPVVCQTTLTRWSSAIGHVAVPESSPVSGWWASSPLGVLCYGALMVLPRQSLNSRPVQIDPPFSSLSSQAPEMHFAFIFQGRIQDFSQGWPPNDELVLEYY